MACDVYVDRGEGERRDKGKRISISVQGAAVELRTFIMIAKFVE